MGMGKRSGGWAVNVALANDLLAQCAIVFRLEFVAFRQLFSFLFERDASKLGVSAFVVGQ